jgi:hypothetical protein
MTEPRILHRGKRALSTKIYGTDEHWRSIPALIGELPIFELAGVYVGYDDEIDAALEAKKANAKRPPPRPRKAAEKGEHLGETPPG